MLLCTYCNKIKLTIETCILGVTVMIKSYKFLEKCKKIALIESYADSFADTELGLMHPSVYHDEITKIEIPVGNIQEIGILDLHTKCYMYTNENELDDEDYSKGNFYVEELLYCDGFSVTFYCEIDNWRVMVNPGNLGRAYKPFESSVEEWISRASITDVGFIDEDDKELLRVRVPFKLDEGSGNAYMEYKEDPNGHMRLSIFSKRLKENLKDSCEI